MVTIRAIAGVSKMEHSNRKALSTKDKVDILLSVSGQHLERVKQLSDREWKTSVLYWTLTLISGSGLISYCAKPESEMSFVVSQHDWLVIVGYGVAAAIYLFAMAGNKHRSLVTERNRYQLTQDAALDRARIAGFRLINADRTLLREKDAPWDAPASTIAIGFGPIKRRRVLVSAVWGAKVLASWAMVSAIWILAQVTSHYVSEMQYRQRMAPAAMSAPLAAGRQASIASVAKATFDPESVDPACAFLICHHRPAPSLTEWPRRAEPGVWCWLAFSVIFVGLGAHALVRGSI